MDNDDADRLASIAYIEHHRKTPDSLFLLRLINEKDAQLARADKVIEMAREFIRSRNSVGAWNLTVLHALDDALAEYDRPSAPLDRSGNG